MLNTALNPAHRSPAFAAIARCETSDDTERRARRVTFLLAIVVLLSGIDLVLTLAFMKSTGMAESNPLVHALLDLSNSATALGFFKVLTVAGPVFVVLCARRFRPAELAAWISVGVLAIVLIQWVRYASFVGGIDPGLLTQMAQVDPNWIVIP